MVVAPLATCTDAYRAWADGLIQVAELRDWSIVLPDGTRCPVGETPDGLTVPVAVHIPAGQPAYQRVDIEDHPIPWGVVVGGILLWLAVLVSWWATWRFGRQEGD